MRDLVPLKSMDRKQRRYHGKSSEASPSWWKYMGSELYVKKNLVFTVNIYCVVMVVAFCKHQLIIKTKPDGPIPFGHASTTLQHEPS
ncbi:hypothetical protein HanXRQr2_Chr04g0192291 [Helianthus annuus]|uniref:Uncharacterized protein n=1 Tax=Helianthus annuus TaxID=4232 RepID=A0A9K3JCD3_HELAN|nr:hypothetical protein HanXRQr2_Chr04g0192291 [Helianthus annuus]